MSSVVVRLPLILLSARSSWATVVPDFDDTIVTHATFPRYTKCDGQAFGQMGFVRHSQLPESVKTVSWNWRREA